MMQAKRKPRGGEPSPQRRNGFARLLGLGGRESRDAGRRLTDASGLRARDVPRITAAEREDLVAGLTAASPRIAAKYFYDALGSHLFEAITRLPEYYPTRTEAAIFSRHGNAIAAAVGTDRELVDLGAGNCAKAASLFDALRPAHYVAVDISEDYLRDAVDALRQRHPGIAMTALGMDLSAGLVLPETLPARRRLFFYPGSSIGNYTPQEAAAFLAQLRAQAGDDGGLLIGVDLVKPKALIDAAYDDALGVTAAFNLNALNHVNTVLGTDFDLREWRHIAFFDPELSRVEMHVETRLEVEVRWPGGSRRFEAGERIHTENSYKYRLEDFGAMLREAGFANVQSWTDQRHWFAVCYASVR
jgi:dimethylhistidine N-methyltransferase